MDKKKWPFRRKAKVNDPRSEPPAGKDAAWTDQTPAEFIDQPIRGASRNEEQRGP
jgi:hypothetical protein